MIKTCKTCLNGEWNPYGYVETNNGECNACSIVTGDDILQEISDTAFFSKSNGYDCVIPISGGGDSLFLAHYVVKVLGLNPLCANYNTQFNTLEGFANLRTLKQEYNLDVQTLTVSPNTIDKLVKYTLWKYGNPFWHVQAATNSYAMRLAKEHRIPLVIFPRCQGQIHGSMFGTHKNPEMSKFYWRSQDIRNITPEDIASDPASGLSITDLHAFQYPDSETIAQMGLRGVFLSSYFQWDSYKFFREINQNINWLVPERTSTLYSFQHADSWMYEGVHDYLRWLKLGHGKILDNLNQEIRFGRLNREDAKSIFTRFSKFDYTESIEFFCSQFNLDINAFHFIANQFRNKSFYATEDKVNHKFLNPLESNLKTDEILSRYTYTVADFQKEITMQNPIYARGY